MKILGVDFGERRTGIAVSDALGITAQGVKTIFESDYKITAEKVLEELKLQGAEKIVLGLPKNMDGSIGFQAQYCLDFKEMLEKEVKLPVIMIDERMTSRMAHNTMLKADMSRNKRKQNVDKLAATIILQSYLDSMPKY